MAPKRFVPGSEQGSINFADAIPVNLNERAAAGRLMGERALSYLGVRLDFLGQVMESDIEAVSIPNLKTGLYDQSTGYRISNLAVNEVEYTTVIRSPEAYTDAVKAGTDRARVLDPVADRREAAAERSVVHAVDGKTVTFESLMDWLNQENSRLQLFRKEIFTPHLSHMKDADLRILASSVWEFSIGNVLNVVARQKDWSVEQLDNAKRAMLERMMHGKQRDRSEYWMDITDLCLQYNRNRRTLFNMKMKQAQTRAQKSAARANDKTN